MSGGMKDLNQITGRLSMTYAETIRLLHRLSVENENSSLPSPLVQASVVAAIFERETLEVFDAIKRGMV